MSMTRTFLGIVTVSAISLGSGMAAAQDADAQAQVEDLQQRYEEAIEAGDWEAVASFYAEDAIYMPLSGGMFEDREGIRSQHEQMGLTALDARSSKTETIGENLILDVGTFTATLSEEAGGTTLEAEYVVLAEVGENGLQIRSLTAFPVRQAPDAPAQ